MSTSRSDGKCPNVLPLTSYPLPTFRSNSIDLPLDPEERQLPQSNFDFSWIPVLALAIVWAFGWFWYPLISLNGLRRMFGLFGRAPNQQSVLKPIESRPVTSSLAIDNGGRGDVADTSTTENKPSDRSEYPDRNRLSNPAHEKVGSAEEHHRLRRKAAVTPIGFDAKKGQAEEVRSFVKAEKLQALVAPVKGKQEPAREVPQQCPTSEPSRKDEELETYRSLWEEAARKLAEKEAMCAETEGEKIWLLTQVQTEKREKEAAIELRKAEQENMRAEFESHKQRLLSQLETEKREKEEAVKSLKAEQENMRAEFEEDKQWLNWQQETEKRAKEEAVETLNAERVAMRAEFEEDKRWLNWQLEAEKKAKEKAVETLNAERAALYTERVAMRAEVSELQQKLAMSESRRKIVELESDRPMWEAARKQREMKEKEEAEKKRKQAELAESQRKIRELMAQEAARKQAEEEGKKRRAMEEEARKAREEAEKKIREREERERKERELRRMEQWKRAAEREQIRCVQRDIRLWGRATWTNESALAKYKVLSDEFEVIKFSETQPLTFEVIPWPVLANPFTLEVQHLEWGMVEEFFAFVRVGMGWTSPEYKGLVEKAHRMFHPDKWKSRGLLNSVPDEELRKSLETAGNVVVQALTPLWRRTKGYD